MIGGIFKKEFYFLPTLRFWRGEVHNVVEFVWLSFYLVLYYKRREENQ